MIQMASSITVLLTVLICSTVWSADVAFFPENIFSPRKDVHNIRSNWFARHLGAMGEPSLYFQKPDEERTHFRLLWLRNNCKPLMFRLDGNNGSGTVTFVQTNGTGGYDPGVVDIRRSRRLKVEEWNRVMELVSKMGFWKQSPATAKVILDGDIWLLEGRTRQDGYHLVNRFFENPKKRPDPMNQHFADLCSALAVLMGYSMDFWTVPGE